MKLDRLIVASITLVIGLLSVSFTVWPVVAQGTAGTAPRVTRPFSLVDTLDGAKFKIRVPGNWNGTLLVYIQGTKIGSPPPGAVIGPAGAPGGRHLDGRHSLVEGLCPRSVRNRQ